MAKRVERWEASNGSLHMTEHEANRAEWADLVLDLLKYPKTSRKLQGIFWPILTLQPRGTKRTTKMQRRG